MRYILYFFLVIFKVVEMCKGWCHDHMIIVRRHRFKQLESMYFMSTGPDDSNADSSNHDSEAMDLITGKKDSLWFSSDESKPLTPAQESLQRYVQSVKADLSEDEFATAEGVDCVGEPSVDPSRQVQSQGDSEWMNDWGIRSC